MTCGYEPVLHALSVEPGLAHPGEHVRLVFRLRNLGGTASLPGTVRFVLPPGLESGEPGAYAVPVGAALPGEMVGAELAVRIAAPLDDGTRLPVQAVLESGDGAFGTNVCELVVCSRPFLDGPLSGVFVETIDRDTVRVRAVVTNEGDGPACGVRIVVPPPLGTVRIDPEVPGGAEFARIEAGAAATIAYAARIVAPCGVLVADGGVVQLAAGTRRALPVRAQVVPEAALAEPEVVVSPLRRAADLAVTVRNAGWADARDVQVRFTFPPALRLDEESVAIDGVPLPLRTGRRKTTSTPFARLERAGTEPVVVIGRIAARTTLRLTLQTRCSSGSAAGEIAVAVAAGAVHRSTLVPFSLESARDVRARLVAWPRSASPGESFPVAVEVLNLGDRSESLAVEIADELGSAADRAELKVDPGLAAVAGLVLRIPAEIPADAALPVRVRVTDDVGECARADARIVLRDPREASTADLAECAHAGADPSRDAEPRLVRATLVAPDTVAAGVPFVVRALVEIDSDTERLALEVHRHPALSYVEGSTTLDGRAVLDRDDACPLFGEGLRLIGIAAGTELAVSWTLIAHAGETTVPIAARCVAGDAAVDLPSAVVAVRTLPLFPLRPTGVTYHVDARTAPLSIVPEASTSGAVAQPAAETEVTTAANSVPADAAQRPPEPAPPTRHDRWLLHVDAERMELFARPMRAIQRNTLVAHLLALRALFPDVEPGADPELRSALATARDAAADVFDRLYVKLRIPGFNVTCSDLEDPVLRGALTALFARLDPSPPATQPEAARLAGDVPFGAPAALRALLALVPSRCALRPALGTAVRAYADALDAALARFDGVALAFFEDALSRDAGFALAEARAAVVAEFPPEAAPIGAAE